MKFVSIEEAYAIHERMLKVGGGRAGIHDFAGKYLYDTIWLMARALLQSMVRDHPFEDGNKRTAYYTTKRFLFKNDYVLQPKKEDVLKFMVNVDVKHTSTEAIASWLKRNSTKNTK